MVSRSIDDLIAISVPSYNQAYSKSEKINEGYFMVFPLITQPKVFSPLVVMGGNLGSRANGDLHHSG